jgi:hypothetical protein
MVEFVVCWRRSLKYVAVVSSLVVPGPVGGCIELSWGKGAVFHSFTCPGMVYATRDCIKYVVRVGSAATSLTSGLSMMWRGLFFVLSCCRRASWEGVTCLEEWT